MLGVVPHQRRHPLVAINAERPECVGELGGPGAGLGVGLAPQAISGVGYHFAVAVHGAAVLHDPGDCQRNIHHRAAHGNLLRLRTPPAARSSPAGRAGISLGWIVPRLAAKRHSARRSESVRSLATARETVLLTVPWLTPSTSATSASVMSSK